MKGDKNKLCFFFFQDSTPEEQELIELRKRNKQLEMENDI
jgi:transposase-like protein